jgi:hypothetical protein
MTLIHEPELLHRSPPLSLNDAQVYASQLLLKRHGYPLWVPEPYGYSVAYRTKGIRIGDVGYVTQDGGFETLFNIRASAQDPVNRRGVPENFEPVDIGEYDIIHTPHYHERGGVVTSMSAQSVSFGVDFSMSQNPYVKCIVFLWLGHSWVLSDLFPPGRISVLSLPGAHLRGLSYICLMALPV